MKLGFGTWQLGGPCTFGGRQTGWGTFDKSEAKRAIDYAVEIGIRFFDTAPGYGKGSSEEFLGKHLSPNPDIKICTKYGSYENVSGLAYSDFSSKSLIKSIEHSLKRLKRDTIDTILLHSPSDDFDYGELGIELFEKLKIEGKIRHYGVSVKTKNGLAHQIKSRFGDSIETVVNILDRRSIENIEIPPNFRIIGRVPLASGFLSNKLLLRSNAEFPPDDIRSSMHDADKDWYIQSIKKLDFLKDLPGGISTSALRYVIHNEKTNWIIPGMRTVTQVIENAKALELGPLDQEIIDKIKFAIPTTNPRWI